MQLKVRTCHQKRVKQHIDAAFMRRKVKQRMKRNRARNHTPQQFVPSNVPMPVRPAKINDEILVMTLIEYTSIWNDIKKVDPSDFLSGIPTIKALEFIVSLQNRVLYAFSDIKAQAQMLSEMAGLFGGIEENAIQGFARSIRRSGQAPTLIDNYSCLHFYLLALQNYNSSVRELTDEDRKNIYKAYLYCSHVWLEKQQRNIKGLGLSDLSIMIDIPVVEFKSYKDFKTQLYKATRFFDFCNHNKHFGQFAQWFFEDKNVANASEYLGRLFHLFCHMAKEPIPVHLQVRPEQEPDIEFYNQFVITPTECKSIWDSRNINYLRDHFILKTKDAVTGKTKLMILNTILLIDKLYQSMMFDLQECVFNKGGGNYKGKPFDDKRDLNSFIVGEFSEHQIFYDTMDMAFPQASNVSKITGKYLSDNGIKGEPDYCLFIDDRLFLFEYKDVKINDATKISSNLIDIKEAILDRICKYEKKRKKGVGQLLFNYDRIFNQHLLDPFGVDVSKVKEVYLIVVTTDTAFNSIGVNALINEEYDRFVKNLEFKVPVRMVPPVIIDFESLFSLIIPLRNKQFDLGSLVYKYLNKTKGPGSKRMMPFCGFLKDYSTVPLLKEQDVPVLFGGFLDMIKKELTQ